ncbi:MAG: FdtA/QdtA family cupin domain-containing protein [Cellulosilyticaceae bacterium]
MTQYKWIDFPNLGDERGNLVVIQSDTQLPFAMKRIFYMYGSEKNVVRGQHANKKSEFVFVCLKGSCKVLIDTGNEKEIVTLDNPEQGLYLDKMVWKDMYEFTEDAVLLVLSNENYDANEYIRDYNDFIEFAKERSQ